MAIKSVSDVHNIISQQPNAQIFHESPAAWEDQVLYFLLPDRFSDGNEDGILDVQGNPIETVPRPTPKFTHVDSGNAIETPEAAAQWREAGGKFVHGNLKGLMDKLGYLKRLGVTALWVGPIFKQVAALETYHGYGVQDFLDIDPRYGTRGDLRDLVKAAHKANIYVVLDIILNHSGNVFQYVAPNPGYSGDVYDVKGFYKPGDPREADIPLAKVDSQYFPDGAIWPAELQDKDCFTRKGRIRDGKWDDSPEFLEGDFFDLKDINIGPDKPENFTATTALKTLCEAYKYWIAYADIDGYRVDTVKHMGKGPTRYFASVIHEYAQRLGKDRFLLMGEITGDEAFVTVEATGLDAALGVGIAAKHEPNLPEKLWNVPKGRANPEEYFNLFRNALYLNKGSHTWFRDKIVCMIDDHDQVWKGDNKGRFCSEGDGDKLVAAAVMLNLCTLGVPCIYYGTEQAFDGSGGSDRYIRESMFGGEFGAFRSAGAHFFNEDNSVYRAIANVTAARKSEMALRRGRQYLRDISGDGVNFGPPRKMSADPIRGIVAWSRLFAGEEVLCAINTDPKEKQSAWVTVDREIHPASGEDWLNYVYKTGNGRVEVEDRGGRSVVLLRDVPAGGYVILKQVR